MTWRYTNGEVCAYPSSPFLKLGAMRPNQTQAAVLVVVFLCQLPKRPLTECACSVPCSCTDAFVVCTHCADRICWPLSAGPAVHRRRESSAHVYSLLRTPGTASSQSQLEDTRAGERKLVLHLVARTVLYCPPARHDHQAHLRLQHVCVPWTGPREIHMGSVHFIHTYGSVLPYT